MDDSGKLSGKTFGIGLSSTGNTSLYAALHEMGYRAGTYRHFREIQFPEWFRGDFSHDYLSGFEAATDLPMGAFFPQLDNKYPGSKFILTVRDVDSWLASVKKQFTSQSEPVSGFRRDVRMAAYGTSDFNEDRFRYIYATHRRNVEWYFANRPDDLLVMNICEGEGWEPLCKFLDRPQPHTPFPRVKPGFQPPASPPTAPADESEAVAFVIPLRNPLDSKVNDYETILALLHQTINSLLQQTHRNIHVIIVSHGTPRWSRGLDPRVTFLDVSQCPTFRPDGLHKNIDKGLRWITGALYAKRRFDPGLIMLLDADDYVHVNLATHLLNRQREEAADSSDGYIINEGVHSLVRVDANQAIQFLGAFAVRQFDRSCGSCRIFKTPNLIRVLQKIDPEIELHFQNWDSPDHQNRVTVPGQCVNWLFDATEGFHQSKEGVLGVIGRHGKQKTLFDLTGAGLCGAAKSCGHGNHEGSRQGAVHWERVRKPISLKRFYQDFGIDHCNSVMPDVSVWRGRLAIVREQLRSKISGE